jgi:hypothetical protein
MDKAFNTFFKLDKYSVILDVCNSPLYGLYRTDISALSLSRDQALSV